MARDPAVKALLQDDRYVPVNEGHARLALRLIPGPETVQPAGQRCAVAGKLHPLPGPIQKARHRL